MPSDWISALIGAGSSFVTSGINSIISGQQNKKQRQFILDQWNRENEYNLPSNQVQRLKDAGLNPYLAYGQGSVTGSTASHAQSYNPQTYQFENPAPYLSSFAQVGKINAEKNFVETQDEKVAEETKTEKLKQLYQSLLNARQTMDNATYEKIAPNIVRKYDLENQSLDASIASIKANTNLTRVQQALYMAQAIRANLENSYFHKDKEYEYSLKDIEKRLKGVQIGTLQSQAKLYEQEAKKTEEEILSLPIMRRIQELDRDYNEAIYHDRVETYRENKYGLQRRNESLRLDNNLKTWHEQYRDKYGIPVEFSSPNEYRVKNYRGNLKNKR